MNQWIQTILGVWLLATLLLITVIDALFLVTGEAEMTVSRWIYNLAYDKPHLLLLIGVAIGHIFLPLVVRNGN